MSIYESDTGTALPSDGVEMTDLGSGADTPSSDGLDAALLTVRGSVTPEVLRSLRLAAAGAEGGGSAASSRCSVAYCCSDPDGKGRPWKTPCCWAFSLLCTICGMLAHLCEGGGMFDMCHQGGLLYEGADCAPLTSLDSRYDPGPGGCAATTRPDGFCNVYCADQRHWVPTLDYITHSKFTCPADNSEPVAALVWFGLAERNQTQPSGTLHQCKCADGYRQVGQECTEDK